MGEETEETMRIIVVGSGGVGSNLVWGLAAMLNYSRPGAGLVVVDGDNFEDKNKERQAFVRFGNKAESKVAELAPQFPQVFMVPLARWVVEEITKEESETQIKVSDLLMENDIVFATVDNHAARKLIFAAAKQYDNIDIFTGGNDEAYFGSIYHYRRRDGKDVTDDPFFYHPEIADTKEKNPGEMSCAERSQLPSGGQLLATNMAVASLLLGKFHHVILNDGNPEANEIFFELAEGKAQSFIRVPDPEEEKEKVLA